MASIIPLKDYAGAQFYPQTHEKAVVDSNGVTLDTKLDAIVNRSFKEAWDGSSTPVVAEIPAGVVVTYSETDYTGTLAASAATAPFIYMVADGNGNYDRYVSELSGSSYVWKYYGNTEIYLSDYATKNDFSQLDQKITTIDAITSETDNLVKFQNSTTLVNGVSVTTRKDGQVVLSGQATASGGRLTPICSPFILEAGTYRFITPTDVFFLESGSNILAQYSSPVFTLTGQTQVYIGANVVSGYTYSAVYNIALFLGEDLKPFVPAITAIDTIARQLVKDTKSEILNEQQVSVNLLTDAQTGYYFTAATPPVKTAVAVYNLSRPILLEPGQKIVANIGSAAVVSAISQVDASGNPVAMLVQGEDHSNDIITYSYEATARIYVVVCYRNNLYYSAKIEYSQLEEDAAGGKEASVELSIVEEHAPDVTTENKYVDNVGNVVSNSNYRTTSPIKLLAGQRIKVLARVGSSFSAISLCDSSGSVYVPMVLGGSTTEYVEHIYDAPSDCFVAVCYSYYFPATITVSQTSKVSSAKKWDAAYLEVPAKMLSMYRKIFCIGDSVTAGHIFDWDNYPSSSGIVVPSLSYPAILSKLTGVSIENEGVSGATPSSWLSIKGGTVDFSSCELAIIEFGYNAELNTTEINSYSQIIDLIRTAHPGAFIVLVISNRMWNVRPGNVAAIKQLAEDEDVPYIDLAECGAIINLDEPQYHGRANETGPLNLVHFNAAGYAAKASVIYHALGGIVAQYATEAIRGILLT